MKLAFAIATSVTALLAVPVSAAVVLDQDNIMTIGTGDLIGASAIGQTADRRQAQLVKAGVTGTLSRVDLQVRRNTVGTGTLVLELVHASSSADLPVLAGTPAASISLLSSATDGFVTSFDVSAANFQVVAGESFAILLRALVPDSQSRFSWVFGTLDADGNLLTTRDYANGYNNLYNVYFDENNVTYWGASGVDRGFATYVDVASVPEPASWAMMIAGFGLTGAIARRRRMLAA